MREAQGETPVVAEKALEWTRDLKFALAGPPITDKEGLERACEQGDAYTYGDNEYTQPGPSSTPRRTYGMT